LAVKSHYEFTIARDMMYRLPHNTAVTKQWASNWPYVANTVSRIVQNHGEKSYFLGFRGGSNRPPPGSAPAT